LILYISTTIDLEKHAIDKTALKITLLRYSTHFIYDLLVSVRLCDTWPLWGSYSMTGQNKRPTTRRLIKHLDLIKDTPTKLPQRDRADSIRQVLRDVVNQLHAALRHTRR